MWIEWFPIDIPSIASRNGTIPPSGYLELLPLRLPFCQATSLLAHWSRLTPVDAARTPGTPQTNRRRTTDSPRIPRLSTTRLWRTRRTPSPSMSNHGSRARANGVLIDRDTPATSERDFREGAASWAAGHVVE